MPEDLDWSLLPPPARHLVMKARAKKPQDRYQTAGAMRADLNQAAASLLAGN